jgi:hypothetical protein
VFALFLLQIVLAGAAPYADARLEADASHADVHLESESADACGLGHDHLFCSMCRALDLRVGATVPAGLLSAAAPVPSGAPPVLRGFPAGIFEDTSCPPRAPPLA